MKILQLRLKNLNSLYGEWRIDFTDPAYQSSGIFALTGATGAGKSTLLDAICLALYGRTPRLGKVSKSSNEIMSRGTAECYAEVLFESQAGVFRCHWGQHRARKKPEGDLQNPKHEIAEGAGECKVIESHLRKVQTAVETRTGMDFERFTRSVLLAQGGFDSFLRADAEQKSRILEQITGTAIYSEISQKVHERRRDEQEHLKHLQAEISGIVILSNEQETELQQTLATQIEQETQQAAQWETLDKAIRWLTGIADLQQKIQQVSEEKAQWLIDREAFTPQQKQLERAKKAAELDGDHAQLMAIRKQQRDDQNRLNEYENALPQSEKQLTQKTALLQQAMQHTLQAKQVLNEANPLLKQVRSLDQTLADQHSRLKQLEQAVQSENEQIRQDQQRESTAKQQQAAAQTKQQQINHYFEVHAEDEWLIRGLTGVETQLNHLAAQKKQLQAHEDKHQRLSKKQQQAAQQLKQAEIVGAQLQQTVTQAENAHQQAKQQLLDLLDGRLLREYRIEKETLLREQRFLSKIASLESERNHLQDEHPCPLCGSTDHPFAKGNIPEMDETEVRIATLNDLIQAAETQEDTIKKYAEHETLACQKQTDHEKERLTLQTHQRILENEWNNLDEQIQADQVQLDHLKQDLIEQLSPLGIHAIDESGVDHLLKSLRQRLQHWQGQARNQQALETDLQRIDGEIQRVQAVIQTRGKALADKQQQFSAQKSQWSAMADERKQLYGEKQADVEEHRLHQAITDCEKQQTDLKAEHDEWERAVLKQKTRIDALQSSIETKSVELKQLEDDFAVAVQRAGFVDEPDFMAARLPSQQRDQLTEKARELDERQAGITARKKEHEQQLVEEQKKQLSKQPLDALQNQSQILEQDLKQLREDIAGCQHQLESNHNAKKRIADKQTAIEAQRTEYARWDRLYQLIGSSDGKKYRNFAQGLTFELMVSHANQQLQKMTDRYVLIRDQHEPLKLNVMDHYQAGETRSIRNLSGGESFIVSLTLALGLSRMASRTVRVDSLFLDEGFGTLDDDALESALETLAGLHQDGKLIGIISHVPALKERIGTQIRVVSGSSGRSVLDGAGCKALSSH